MGKYGYYHNNFLAHLSTCLVLPEKKQIVDFEFFVFQLFLKELKKASPFRMFNFDFFSSALKHSIIQ